MKDFLPKILLIILVGITSLTSFAQEVNQKLFDNESKEEILIGYCTRKAFLSGEYKKWFIPGYDDYKTSIKSKTLDSLKTLINNVDITIILGTWCHDSREQVPRFFRIVDYLRFDEKKITLICLDRDKKASSLSLENYNVVLVPTFIFYMNGKEIGRIIETPEISLEEDIYKIIKSSY